MRMTSRLWLPALLGVLLGCGGGSHSSAPLPTFHVETAALTLPVPPASNVDAANKYYPSPYSGTATFTVSRDPGFTGAVTLALDTTKLPTGVKAAFANTVIASDATTAVLSVQAGYPDPADTTFTKQIYPSLGTYDLPVTASASGVPNATVNLSLKLVTEPADFGLSLCSADGASFNDLTTLSMPAGAPLTETFMAYWALGTFSAPYGPVALSVQGVSPGLSVGLDTSSATLNDVHTMTITAQPGLAAGTYSFLLTGSYLGLTRSMPVLVTYSPSPFSLQPALSSTGTLAQGQALAFPCYLWHNDAYFGTTTPADGTDPLYVGSTELSVSGNPAGLAVGFANANPTGLASVPLQISAASSLAPGSYPVTLQATRVGATTTVPAAPLVLTVNVTDASASPTLWIQNVEWGQSVVSPHVRLVGGKPALLRVHLLADRAGVTAPVVTATIRSQGGATLDNRTLQGPATVPTTILEGDLPSASRASGSTYTVILPAADIQPGMQVTVQAGALSQTLSPSVDPGTTLNLTVVPVYCQGVAPVLPADSVMSRELSAFWPVQGVTITHHAPYTTSTVIPQPSTNPLTDTSGDGWGQLLSEMATLRLVDGSSANYYGFFNPGLKRGFTQSIAGISLLGDGTGIGVDETTAALFQNDDPGLDLATTVMVHEEGHAFNLNHAPAGGAGAPQLNYPYAGAATGSWGFDPVSQAAYDPAATFDIMSYASNPHWVSDWDYVNALGFLGEKEKTPVGLGSLVAAAPLSEQWVISGVVRPDGQVHLSPLVRVACVPAPPRAGDLHLVLTSATASRTVAFSATQVPDLAPGYRHFAFTVPASEELVRVDVPATAGKTSSRRSSLQSLPLRAQMVAASVQDGSLVVRESDGTLHLEWDALAHPFVSVLHEGTRRTTLGLNLSGGSADLPLDGVPSGGQFVIHFSDGLNAVIHNVPRGPKP
ncbi:hypothetical protein GETHLI_14250 [Geothrix limicola]|uniref:Uncharacterized protein n=1 Tax=Geothrix limicola TaxID=2927978 RepID=A0ABQ5QE34_9BACT|nr:M66 family metalloprotease [Geothrix limicola]GLH72923.1 hypothetical protein GETHLI_14250 [Geothrix limicola]